MRQGTYIYGILRDVSEEHVAQAALRNLLLSSSFDLRVSAQNVGAAAALLREHDAVRCDAEAVFLAGAIQSSCNLLLGASRSWVLCCSGATCASDVHIAMHDLTRLRPSRLARAPPPAGRYRIQRHRGAFRYVHACCVHALTHRALHASQ
jgi:hypothetical protein